MGCGVCAVCGVWGEEERRRRGVKGKGDSAGVCLVEGDREAKGEGEGGERERRNAAAVVAVGGRER